MRPFLGKRLRRSFEKRKGWEVTIRRPPDPPTSLAAGQGDSAPRRTPALLGIALMYLQPGNPSSPPLQLTRSQIRTSLENYRTACNSPLGFRAVQVTHIVMVATGSALEE